MKIFELTGLKEMQLNHIDDPVIEHDNQVKIKMKSIGVCGSDVHYYNTGRIGSQVVEYPFAVGHEGAGMVTEIGSGVTRVKPGDKVAIDPAMPCGECDQCKKGREHTCRNLKFLGCPGQAPGCLSDYIVMPEDSCFKIPQAMTYEEAALIEPLSIGVYGVRKAIVQPNDSVGILGFGPIGMSVMLALQSEGIKNIHVTDKIDERLNIAKNQRAAWIGNPEKSDVVDDISNKEPLLLDVVFECCGQQDAMDNAIDLLKPGGKLILIGIPEFDRWTMSADKIRRKELVLQNIRRQLNCVQAAIDLIKNKKVDVSAMKTHQFPFSQTQKAFDLVSAYHDGVMKAMIHFD